MNDLPEITAKAEPMATHVGARGMLCTLKDLSVGADYDITLRLSDSSSPKNSECTHHLKGNSNHSLINLLAIGGLIAAGAGAILCLVNCCRK